MKRLILFAAVLTLFAGCCKKAGTAMDSSGFVKVGEVIPDIILEVRHGFKTLDSEWWHFTLKDEPYPDTYFEFPLE